MRAKGIAVAALAGSIAGSSTGCHRTAQPAPAAAAVGSSLVPTNRAAATQAMAPPSASSVVQGVFDDIAAGRGDESLDVLYDPHDPLAREMLDGSPALRTGATRLRVHAAKELDDCAAVLVSKTADGSETQFVTYLARKDGGWKVILPAGNYRQSQPDRYPWTADQRGKMERLRQWAHDTAGIP